MAQRITIFESIGKASSLTSSSKGGGGWEKAKLVHSKNKIKV